MQNDANRILFYFIFLWVLLILCFGYVGGPMVNNLAIPISCSW